MLRLLLGIIVISLVVHKFMDHRQKSRTSDVVEEDKEDSDFFAEFVEEGNDKVVDYSVDDIADYVAETTANLVNGL